MEPRQIQQRLRKAPLALAVAGALVSPIVLAQTQLEEVTVTAQKREQGINDIGMTVNAFSADQMANFGVKSAEDLESMVPGLTVSNSQPNGTPVYTIRGVGFNDFTTAASSTVGLYMDGASIPYSVMSRGALYDLARIEVLKGPQGDLYGRNTTAGQINFISRKPTDALEAGVRLDYSSYETVDLEGYVSGPLSDSIRGRLAVKSVNSGEGWQESITRPGDELGERDELGVRAILDFDITDDISLMLNLRHSSNESENIAGAPTFVGGTPVPTNYTNEDADWTPDHRPQDDSDHDAIIATLSWDMGTVSLTSITSYDSYQRHSLYDTSAIPLSDADITNNTDIDVFSQEIRLESNDNSSLYWLAGMFYSNDDLEESYEMDFLDTVGLHLINNYEQDSESIAIFGHMEWSINEQFRLTLGARYAEDERDWAGCTFDTGDGALAGFYNFFVTPEFLQPLGFDPAPVQPGGCASFNDIPGTSGYGEFGAFSDNVDTDELMSKVSLDYSPNDEVLYYGTISTGFKSGGFNGAASQMHSQLVPYDKEELTSFELGVKATLLDQNMQLNAAAFFYDYQDKQELTNFISPIGDIVGITNVPESSVYGAELEMAWLITEGLQFNLGVAYLNTEIDEFTANCPAGLFGPPPPGSLPAGCPEPSSFGDVKTFDASGNRLDNGPEWQATGTLSYTWSLSDKLMMAIAGDVSYKDDNSETQAAPDDGSFFYIPDYTLVNARVSISSVDGKWDATLWGRNITDEYYWHSTNQSNVAFARTHGMGETYGITLSYNYF